MSMSIQTKIKRIKARRAKWAAALRSGEYDQTTGMLQVTQAYRDSELGDPVQPVGYCCLGVAACVAKKSRAIKSFNPEDGGLDASAAEWLGIDGEGGGATTITRCPDTNDIYPPAFIDLFTLNDDWHLTFAEIADLIEEPGVLRIYIDGVEYHEDGSVAA